MRKIVGTHHRRRLVIIANIGEVQAIELSRDQAGTLYEELVVSSSSNATAVDAVADRQIDVMRPLPSCYCRCEQWKSVWAF